jgi:branched-chain amino acid transport system permease protein
LTVSQQEPDLPPSGYIVQQLANALIVGSFYSLLAVSYALVHGLTNRIVLAFGDMAMFSAFSAIYGAVIGWSLGFDTVGVLATALLGTVLSSAALGVASLRTVFDQLMRGSNQALLIGSASFGLVLQEVMRLQSGGREQWLEPILSDAVIETQINGFIVRISAMQALIVAGTAMCLLSMLAVMRLTPLGRLWRACSEDAALAALIGIDVRKVMAFTFIVASAYAGAAGLTLAIYYGGVSFYMGLVLGLKALFASIIGGFGTIGGAVAGAFVLALLETLWAAFFPLGYRDVAVFAIVLSVLILRPEGLLGVRLRKDYER